MSTVHGGPEELYIFNSIFSKLGAAIQTPSLLSERVRIIFLGCFHYYAATIKDKENSYRIELVAKI